MKQRKQKQGGLVYSTDHGRMCPGCRQPADQCGCVAHNHADSGDGVVRVGRETKGRKGKGVTTVTGAPLVAGELAKLGKSLKQLCGSGGTVKNGVIEIQGDHRDRIVEALAKRGWTVKKAGS